MCLHAVVVCSHNSQHHACTFLQPRKPSKPKAAGTKAAAKPVVFTKPKEELKMVCGKPGRLYLAQAGCSSTVSLSQFRCA